MIERLKHTVFQEPMPLQVAQIFMPILNKSPLANFTASKFGSFFGQGLVFLQNAASGLA